MRLVGDEARGEEMLSLREGFEADEPEKKDRILEWPLVVVVGGDGAVGGTSVAL